MVPLYGRPAGFFVIQLSGSFLTRPAGSFDNSYQLVSLYERPTGSLFLNTGTKMKIIKAMMMSERRNVCERDMDVKETG